MPPLRLLTGAVRGIATAGHVVLDVLYPPRCWLCEGHPTEPWTNFCLTCREQRIVPLPLRRCDACAGGLDALGVCPDCLGARLPFERIVCAGTFDDGLRELVHGLKFGGRWHHSMLLADLITACLTAELEEIPSLIVPVPLVLLRRLRRGYNQAELIARELARRTGGRCDAGVLARTRLWSPRQAQLTRAKRERNVREGFVVRRKLPKGASVLLVDDVITTARTVRAAAEKLREAGAGRIVVAAAARSRLRSL